MEWIWDQEKDRINKKRHGLSFDTAKVIFEDPLAVSRPDPYADGDRWQTVGLIGSTALFVVHTWPDSASVPAKERGRIISARKATAHERRAYEEGQF